MRQLQKEIISKLNVQPMIQPKEELRTRVDFIKDYLKKYPFIESLVLGISGGQDSTLAGRIAQIAINEMREETGNEAYQFIAVRLPYGEQNDEEDAKKALEFIQADRTFVVNIKSSVDSLVNEFKENSNLTIDDFNKGNIKARIRMVTQYGIAGEFKGAVLGTDHAAENVTGFFTKFGDGAADILPLSGLNKRQGRQLLQVLGADESLYLKVPTADLEEDKPMVADEVALGVTYEAIDDYLEGKEVSETQAKTIEGWYLKTQHKRHLPITKDDTFWK
ncbi:ammonia-dependent NAD(+) synthetase [Vagococcus carniphilus]|uniref:NH(3)-dependent NAD(+) synthetase n=1 Tax=Vagococcus carniphilus TaxID=218144 RepID=A0A430B1C0_9ENTE|nr:ammonia-dependent NAD(+) synthetase [Vagococcus carniphilus]QNN74079.1 ammonia-dependent NAD(+) synthetase [Vagococcus carniphilus]RSU14137.1 NAD(+) synthase [Vagococcus carniphilus]